MPDLTEAMIEQGTQRSTAGYAALAREYVANLDTIDPDAILGASFPEGQSARRDGRGQIVITVTDDGKGIDPAKVKESAVAKGLISAEAAARMSEPEARDLLLMPGLSTQEQAT